MEFSGVFSKSALATTIPCVPFSGTSLQDIYNSDV